MSDDASSDKSIPPQVNISAIGDHRGMRFISSIILLYCIQNVFIVNVWAQEGSSTETGATLLPSSSSSAISSLNNFIESSSALNENEKNESENSSIESSSVSSTAIASPLLVRISEVAWMGSDLSTADEWLEINAVPAFTGAVTTSPINLRGWSLSIQKDTGETVIALVEQDLWIGSGEYLVIANSPALSSRLKREPALLSTAMSLPNTKLQLRLRDTDGVLQDTIDDFVGAPFAGVNPSVSSGLPKATMERIDLHQRGDDKANWKTAITKRGFDAAALMLGTPGYPNGTIEPQDVAPPPPIERLRAFRWSGSLLIGWAPIVSFDVSAIRLTVGAQILDLSATSTGVVIVDPAISSIGAQTIDESGNASPLIEMSPITIDQPLLSELLADPGPGKSEWIELGNPFSVSIDLNGWKIEVGSKKFSLSTVLQPGEYSGLDSVLTGLQFPNGGGEVRLTFLGRLIDRIVYLGYPTGVAAGHAQPYCVPSPGEINSVRPITIRVDGVAPNALNPSTLNLNILAVSGSLAGGSCIADFGDGFVSTSCNPPNHSMRKSGSITLHVEAKDFCGNTVIQNIPVIIDAKRTSKTSSSSSPAACIPTSTGGVTISEFLPAPTSDQEEWIELYNATDLDVDLCGWSIDDNEGGSKSYHLDNTVIRAGEYLVLPSSLTKLSLNNDADSIRLIGPQATGGTGILLSLPYLDALSGQSFAVRSDQQWLWTPFSSPGTENRFTPIDPTPGISPVILSAALPNPLGADTWEEWIELENLTGRPQWMNGWRIERTGGQKFLLDGVVLSKKESLRLALAKTPLVLGNKIDTLRLIDEQGMLRSVIAWEDATDGHVIRPAEECTSAGIIPISEIFPDIKYEFDNFYSALIKEEKFEYQNCSMEHIHYLLLEAGLAIADPQESPTRLIYQAYEDVARAQKRGVWARASMEEVVSAWKENRKQDEIAQEEGLVLIPTIASSLLSTGSVVSVETNVPADLWVRRGTGSWIRFDEGIFIASNGEVSFRAQYSYKTFSGSSISTVVTREYGLVDEFYPSCITMSEVYPSPKTGEKEWLELMNTCSFEVSLWGWRMDDELGKGSKPFSFGTGITIGAESMLVLSGSHLPLTLNNEGDSLHIFSPNGHFQAGIDYPSIGKGESYLAFTCITTRPTPGSSNICIKATKTPSKAVKVSKTAIGLSSKFGAVLLDAFTEENAKNDQFYGLIEGLNSNIMYLNDVSALGDILLSLLFILGVGSCAAAIALYCRKYRLWQ